jgi:hypothetical protein
MSNIPFLNNAYFSANIGIGGEFTPGARLDIREGSKELQIGVRGGDMNIFSLNTSGVVAPIRFEASEFEFVTGIANFAPGITASKYIRVLSSSIHFDPISGKSLEIRNTSGVSSLISYDRDNSTFEPITIDGSYVTLKHSGNDKLETTNTGVSVTGDLSATDGLFSGDVGVGTTSPSRKLEVRASSEGSNGGIVLTDFTDGTSMVARIQDSSTGGRLYLKTDTDVDGIVLNAGGDSYFNNGNVGIGTDSPQSKAHISSGSTSETTLTIGASADNTNVSARIFLNEGENTVTDSKKFGFSLAYNGAGGDYGLTANEFAIIRHDNSEVGSKVLSIQRATGAATFASDLTAGGNLTLGAAFEIKNESGTYWQRIRTEDAAAESTKAFNFEVRKGSGAYTNLASITNAGDLTVTGDVSAVGGNFTGLVNIDGTPTFANFAAGGDNKPVVVDANGAMGVNRGYMTYVAVVNQIGTNAPTVIILENTFPNAPYWSYIANGIYEVDFSNTSPNVFQYDRLFCHVSNGDTDGWIRAYKYSPNTYTNYLVRVEPYYRDNSMTNAFIEIRSYN